MSGNDADRDIAKDLLSSLLTQRQGEYIIRIGQQPPHTKLFADELADNCDGWSGVSRRHDEIDKLRTAIIETVEEIGGKVRIPLGGISTNLLATGFGVARKPRCTVPVDTALTFTSALRVEHARSPLCGRRQCR